MKTEFNFSIVPHQYALCINTQCPKAATCLRQLAEKSTPSDVVQWSIISPKHIATFKDNCPYYRSSKKVLYAKGFIDLLENLTHKQMQRAVDLLMSHYNRRTYYRMRKGDRPISPAEQKSILRILANAGIKQSLAFDTYYEEYEW